MAERAFLKEQRLTRFSQYSGVTLWRGLLLRGEQTAS